MTEQKKYFTLKNGKAIKVSLRSTDNIDYVIVSDQAKNLYIVITGHDGSGTYYKSPIRFSKVEDCIKDIKPEIPIFSTKFKSVFDHKNNNNCGFLTAILRAEKLLEPYKNGVIVAEPDIEVKKSLIQPNWDDWKVKMLSLSN